MIRMKALILYGDGTQTLPVARSLKKLKFEVSAIFKSKWTYGYSSRYIKKKYIFDETEDIDALYKYVDRLLNNECFDIVIPMHDRSAEMLSKYRQDLFRKVRFVMPNYQIFQEGFDKHRLMKNCQKYGYPHPKTTIVEGNTLEGIDVNCLYYPLLIKPNNTWGARGMTLCRTKDELLEKFPIIVQEFGKCHLQRYIKPGGHQVEVQIYMNEDGELVQSSVIKKFRWYPENGGSSCCNVSYKNDKIVDICYHLAKSIGWVGFADFDTIEDPDTGELLIMELNPRVPACVKSCFVSGIDWSDVIANEYLGRSHKSYKMEKEVYLRHLGFDLLWFFFSKSRFRTKPNWFHFIGRKVYYQDISSTTDLLPFITGTLGNFVKQLSPSFRESKSGAR